MHANTGIATPRRETIEVDGRVFNVEMEQDPEDGWWVGLVDELPGAGSQGATLAELRCMVADAIHGILIVRGEVPEDDPTAVWAPGAQPPRGFRWARE